MYIFNFGKHQIFYCNINYKLKVFLVEDSNTKDNKKI